MTFMPYAALYFAIFFLAFVFLAFAFLARNRLRAAGIGTVSAVTTLVDFAIVGAQKAGTTSLDHYLSQHPDVFMPAAKDFWLFIDVGIQSVTETNLDGYYGKYDGERVIGASNVQMMHFPSSIDRLHAYNPKAKLIVVLRNPIDRAYSAYWFSRRLGRETCETFELALEKEPEWRHGSVRDQAELTYLQHGHYYDQLKYIYGVFDRSQIFVCLFEDIRENPERLVSDIFNWLELDPSRAQIDFAARLNESARPRSMLLQRTLGTPHPAVRQIYYNVVPERLRHFILRNVIHKILGRNLIPFRYPPMQPETRERLADYFSLHNERLSEIIGRDVGHWQ